MVIVPLLLLSAYAIFDSDFAENEGTKVVDSAKEEIAESGWEMFFDSYEDVAAWLKIDGTIINYPVMQAKNNSWYLVRDFKGDYSGSGSIFMDYRNRATDDYMIIYGHRMSGENMFSEIAKFADKDYFDSHTSGVFRTRNDLFKLIFYAYAEVSVSTDEVYDLATFRNSRNDEVIAAVMKNAKVVADWKIKPSDKLVILSTCDRERKDFRDILLAKIVEF